MVTELFVWLRDVGNHQMQSPGAPHPHGTSSPGRHVALRLLGVAVLATLLTIGIYRVTAVPAPADIGAQPATQLTAVDQPIHSAASSADAGQTAPVARTAPAAALGIDAPAGMDVRTMGPGLTDYLRADSTVPSVHAPAAPFGIDCPAGALETLPSGLTDYCRR